MDKAAQSKQMAEQLAKSLATKPDAHKPVWRPGLTEKPAKKGGYG